MEFGTRSDKKAFHQHACQAQQRKQDHHVPEDEMDWPAAEIARLKQLPKGC